MHWGRQTYRWNQGDFEANAKDGYGVDWPIRYEELVPWYTRMEKFVGISGRTENLAVLPDSTFLPAMPMTPPEQHFRDMMQKKMNRPVTVGRVANLSKPQPWHTALGRASCQYRNKCVRGCPYGAYYSSLSGAIPAARLTKRLDMLHDSIVAEVLYDEKTKRATGVRVINQHTNAVTEYFARIIFLNAGSMNTAALLLNSTSNRFPNGLGNDSDQVGRNIMDHHLGVGANASVEVLKMTTYSVSGPTRSTSPASATGAAINKRTTCAASVTRAGPIAATGSAAPAWTASGQPSSRR